MASTLIKSLLFALTVLQLLCSSSGVSVPGLVKGVDASLTHVPERTGVEFENLPGSEFNKRPDLSKYEKPVKVSQIMPEKLDPNFEEMHGENKKHTDPKTFGESLAEKYYVKEFISGFRWGYKAYKRIQSVASKCDRALKPFIPLGPYCPQPAESNLLPADNHVVNCIVEITNLRHNGTCIRSYESYDSPPEATCVLNQSSTLDVNYCSGRST